MYRGLTSKCHIPILVFVVLSVYSVTLKHGFVWDDTIYTIGNTAYKEFDLRKIFFSLGNGVEYLPLRDVTYAFDYFVWGENPLGYHLTNLVLFLLNVLLIYYFSAELSLAVDIQKPRSAAFLTALFFAVHPLISESVNFITCRNVLLSSVCFFVAALIFIRYIRNDEGSGSFKSHAALAIFFIAALLSKATAIVLPLILILIAVMVPSRRTVRQKLVILTPLVAIGACFFFIFRDVALQSGVINQISSPLTSKIITAVQIPFFYLQKLFIPLGYSASYSADKFSETASSPSTLLSLAGIALLTTVAVVMRKKTPEVTFSILWFGITLLPVLNFFKTFPVVADRYAYLPSFAFAYIAGSTLIRLRERFPVPVAFASCVLVLLLGGTTFARNLDWRSDLTLWKANIKTEPAEAKGYVNLVAGAITAGDLRLARNVLNEGRSMAPSPNYDFLEGNIYYQLHDLPMALQAFHAAVRQNNDHIRSLLEIGLIYHELGDFNKAAEYYRRTLSANAPDGRGCRENARVNLMAIEGKLLSR